ncbi:MAG: M1 family metallopeptidase [Bacteroidetes bacterium]|nr:M1 family metallopeptidase [Bacteroidota bacterium]MBS1756801.1 M1 family metallopeptidase [Bacteroidota bacterium]
MYYKFITIALVVLATRANSQSLYMPRDVKEAYKNETRALDGKPGKKYWQNFGKYDIDITVTPPSRVFKGVEKITYFNNSPDSFFNPVFKLILNIHKQLALRFSYPSPDYMSDGITIDEITCEGKPVPFKNPNSHFTWQQFKLPKLLLPHDSVELTVSWHAELSKQSGREGMLDSTTYYLAYFYPRFAVCDDINGWDKMEFTDAQEFYNDFNDYKISVHAPKNFIVWSTGTLQNPGEVLAPKYAALLDKSMNADEVINIATQADIDAKNVTAQNDVNTWKWKADNVTDIAMAISDHYVWDASSVVVDAKTGRRASVQSAYKSDAKDFHYMVNFGRHALSWLSNNWPGIAYPFPKTTIVQGFADMEYPMMVNDATTPDTTFSKFVAEHEIAHSWFPFYMGINEHRYGFMDEGWATTFEYLIGISDMGKEKAENFYKKFRVESWINDKSADAGLPIITAGNLLNGKGLGYNQYGKASLGYLAMKDLLGDNLFRKCLQGYMQRWNGKHPIPWDFFYSFNDIAGKNLNWFWNSWYFSHGYIDIAIKNVHGRIVTLQNIGGFPAPFDAIVSYEDGSTATFHHTPSVWQKNIDAAIIQIPGTKKIKTIKIDGGIFMDADTSNNSWTAK